MIGAMQIPGPNFNLGLGKLRQSPKKLILTKHTKKVNCMLMRRIIRAHWLIEVK